MNKMASHLLAAAVGASLTAALVVIPLRLEIDLLRAAAIRSAARETEHDKQITAALDISRQIEPLQWQAVTAARDASAARSAAQELLKMAKARRAQPAPKLKPARPAPLELPPAPVKAAPRSVAVAIDADKLLAAHNRWRSEVGVPDLRWSGKLAAVAQGWADHLAGNNCAMYHSGNGLGENIYQASALMWPDGHREFRAVPSRRPVDAWGEEKQWYNAETGKCSAMGKNTCGHYTQVIWKDTTEVGCAMAVCGNNAQVWVCNYSPAGNIVGQKPF